jgi:peptidoglycan/xylan/chitin deacetylase (PgdA/CDA1 family)
MTWTSDQIRQMMSDMGGTSAGAEKHDPLERLLGLLYDPGPSAAHDDVQIVGRRDAEPTWLIGDDWQLFARPSRELISGGEEIAQFELPGGEKLSASFDRARKSVYLPFSPAEAYRNYLTEAWTAGTPRRGLSQRQLQTFYRAKRFIPRPLQIRGRRVLIHRQGFPEFPRWPLDGSVSRLFRFYAYCVLLARGERALEFRWFWPAPYRAAMILTHDVETAEGLPLAVELADLEEAHGFRSSFNLGGWYDVDPGIVRELARRGFEIGMHGLRHDRTLFSSRAAFETQLPKLASLAANLGAEGFRSPSTYRVFDWLAELPVSYDGSIPHSDPFEPQPGGCCSLWPFFIGDVVELPYTLPQDYTLFTLLGQRSPALWLEQAEQIVREYGLIHVLTHPDPGYLGAPRNRERYREFLVALSERHEIWKPLPRELAAWWRLRDTVQPAEPSISLGVVRIGEAADEVDLQPIAAVERLHVERP